MKTPNHTQINANRARQLANAESQRSSEVARIASDIQKQTGCARTEALRAAERTVPRT